MNQKRIPKIDAHTHLFYDRAFLMPLLEQWNLRVVVINITGKHLFEESMRTRWEAMVAIKEAHPEHVTLCTTFDPTGVNEPGFADRVIRQLRADIEQGAAMVKVWKDIGLVIKDEDGRYIQVDDERFQPIWEFLAEQNLPVLAHIGEPRAAWQPLDENSPHYTFYRDHPEHHLYEQEDVPDWEEIIAARDRWIEQHPELTIIGAHFGSMAHDVSMVAERLNKYPNFYVDTAERFGDLIVQPSDTVRDFFMQYPDRIFYGTDVIVKQPASDASEKEQQDKEAEYQDFLQSHWEYLAGDEVIGITDHKFEEPVSVQSLNLPREVLEQVYAQNAERLLF